MFQIKNYVLGIGLFALTSASFADGVHDKSFQRTCKGVNILQTHDWSHGVYDTLALDHDNPVCVRAQTLRARYCSYFPLGQKFATTGSRSVPCDGAFELVWNEVSRGDRMQNDYAVCVNTSNANCPSLHENLSNGGNDVNSYEEQDGMLYAY